MEKENICGIYKITNPFNQIYIGQSVNIERRFKSHQKGIDSNFHLMMSIGKHGVDNHMFEILEECDKDSLTEKENHYLSIYKKNYLLFNYSVYLFKVQDCFKLIDSCDFGIDELNKVRIKREENRQFFLENRKVVKTNSIEVMKEIKTLYGKLKDKRAFCLELSKESGIDTSERTIYNHWFGGFFEIPEDKQDLVLTKLKEKE